MAARRLVLRRQPVTFTFVMRVKSVNLKRALTAFAVTLCLAGTARAQDSTQELLDRLATASEQEAPLIVRELEAAWERSGSAAMDLLLRRGREALEDGDFPRAIEHLSALTDHAPDFAEGYHARAEAFFRRELFGPALDDLERTLTLNPDNFNAIYGLGVVLQELGDTSRAARLYRRTLALHPHHENARKALDYLRRDGIGLEL